MIKKFYQKRLEKRYNINVVKSYLKKFDDLSFDNIKCFYDLENAYISFLKKLDIDTLNMILKDLEYDLKRRHIRNQNTNRDLDMSIISFLFSICILYIDDHKYDRIMDYSLSGIAAIALLLALFLFVSHFSKFVNDSNGVELYIEFKKKCIEQAINIKSDSNIKNMS